MQFEAVSAAVVLYWSSVGVPKPATIDVASAAMRALCRMSSQPLVLRVTERQVQLVLPAKDTYAE